MKCDLCNKPAVVHEVTISGGTKKEVHLCLEHAQAAGIAKESMLPFEGFLEALSRAALLKAWPTPDEVEDSQCEDAGAYLRDLRKSDAAAFKALCEERAAAWGAEPLLPVPQCVENMVLLIIRTVESQLGLGDDSKREQSPKARAAQSNMALSQGEARTWRERLGRHF